MKRSIFAIAGLLGWAFTQSPAHAHDEYRVIGTIAEHKGTTMVINAKDGRTANIHLDKNTEISRDDAKAPASELKVGRYVVVDAYGDDYSDMLALNIKLVPPPAK